MKMKILICLAAEAVFVLAMSFFGNYRELQQGKDFAAQIIWRLILAAPVMLIVFDSVFSKPARYKTIMALTLIIILAADIVFIFKFEAGLVIFMIVHILNTVNFTMLSRKVSTKAVFAVAAVILSFILYKTTLEAHLSGPMMKIALQFYMFLILVSFWRALETAGTSGLGFTIMISAGTLVFFVGDYFVARDVFLGEKYHQIINNVLYYVPHVLLALSAACYEPIQGKKAQGV